MVLKRRCVVCDRYRSCSFTGNRLRNISDSLQTPRRSETVTERRVAQPKDRSRAFTEMW